jgi:hypothetical protein
MGQHRPSVGAGAIGVGLLLSLVALDRAAHAEEKTWYVRDLQLFDTGGEPLIVGETGFGAVVRSAVTGEWSVLCPSALGLPPLTSTGHNHSVLIRPDGRGRLLALTTSGLRRADQAACGWKSLLETTREFSVLSVASWPPAPDRLWVLAGGYVGKTSVQAETRIQVSEDGGRTFLPRGALPQPWLGISVAMPNWDTPVLFARASHRDTEAQAFFRSADGGATWVQVTPVPAVPGGDGFWPILLGMARKPGVLYFLVNGQEPGSPDEIWVSRDAGQTARRTLVVDENGIVSGLFADPQGDELLVTAVTAGNGPVRGALYASLDSGVTFEPAVFSPVRFNCIKRWQGKLLACQHNRGEPDADFDVGVSEDGGRTWKAQYRLIDTAPPLGCLRDACRADYEFVKSQVTPGMLAPDEPDAGAPAADAAAGAPGQGQAGCSASRAGTGAAGPLMAVLALLGIVGRRKRCARDGKV